MVWRVVYQDSAASTSSNEPAMDDSLAWVGRTPSLCVKATDYSSTVPEVAGMGEKCLSIGPYPIWATNRVITSGEQL